ncbi:hypothetical protein LPJ78_002010 [Coemansia sp. RSA 989]|nr:hypothetical protein LPJ78_002010 [Coemansia sp. RSA 989]
MSAEKDTPLKPPSNESATSLRNQSADNESRPSVKTTSKKPRARNQKPPTDQSANTMASKDSQSSRKGKPPNSNALSKPATPITDANTMDKPAKAPVSRRQRKKATKAQQTNTEPSGTAASTAGQPEEKPQTRPRNKRANRAEGQSESSQAGSETSAKQPQVSQSKPKLTRREKRAIKQQQQEGSVSVTSVSESYKLQPADLRLDSGIKVCVRWLPADLPEHVFWQSVEPALPWFDPNLAGTVKKEARPVLSALGLANDTPLNENETASSPEQTETTETDEPVMALAPTTMTETSVYKSPNLERLDSKPYWRQYVPGKQHKSKAKSLSRAYIVFAAPSEAEHFYRKYHGHVFSKNGTQTRAIVELAPFQSVAWLYSPEKDPLQGTFESDPAFKEFATQQFVSQVATGSPSNGDAENPHKSYAAAAAKPSDTSASEFVATPLIKYLHEVKARSFKGKPTDKTNVASAKTPPRSSKAAPAPAPAAKKTREKRTRRQNR